LSVAGSADSKGTGNKMAMPIAICANLNVFMISPSFQMLSAISYLNGYTDSGRTTVHY
jgi:hypothetical protein